MMPMQRLRTRLEADRAELAELLAATPDDRHLDCGLVRMLADVQGALEAVHVTERGPENCGRGAV